MARLEHEIANLDGPMKNAARQMLQNLQGACGNTNDPAELARLDQMIGDAMKAIGRCGDGPLSRSSDYQCLLRVSRQAGDMCPNGGQSPGAPGFGQDTFGSPGAPRGNGTNQMGRDDYDPSAGAPRADTTDNRKRKPHHHHHTNKLPKDACPIIERVEIPVLIEVDVVVAVGGKVAKGGPSPGSSHAASPGAPSPGAQPASPGASH